MPPKRRRTIAAVSTLSTALDSLRAKIHHFADTADEEQLREVAQLIDHLSSPNRNPLRLLDLPYELLEYTAERYFNRNEAVPVLPVNRVLSELFANSIWRCIESTDIPVSGYNLPHDALMKNVRRIRAVNLRSIKPDFFVSGFFAYATSITFQVEREMETMFTLHLEQMKYLRRVIIILNSESHNVINVVTKWINDSHRSGHVQQIVIDAAYYPINQRSIHVLTSLMDMIKFKKRIRLDCAHREPFPNSIIQYMPVTLTKLNIAEAISMSCCGAINKQVFGTDPDSVFVHLRVLSVKACCSNSSLYHFQSFVPERFPVLRRLSIRVPRQTCIETIDTPLVTIFSNNQWLSIADFKLVGNSTKAPGIGQLAFKAMPALQKCTFQYMVGIDTPSGLDTRLTISELSLTKTFLKMSRLRGNFACLVRLELNGMEIDLDYLQLMASCKRLVEIKLIGCDIAEDMPETVSDYPCSSVRKVVISYDDADDFTDDIAHILPAFPNIRVLDLTYVPEDKRMDLVLKCPSFNIIT
ncbi:hypothetical protein GQ42DRAFT_38638 [Ramicandelaber brevisporus]|nr:hypothetical protein GQ42DRAFT_38638 [Ramicandelaber brevisporus]